MARVPYDPVPSVAPEAPPGNSLDVPTNPDEFGGARARALGELGQAGLETGTAVLDAATAFQQRRNELAQQDGIQHFGQVLANAEQQLHTKKGAAAGAALPAFGADLNSQMNSIAEGMPSQAAALGFQQEAGRYLQTTMRSAGLYVADEHDKALSATYDGKMATIANLATLHYSDPNAIDQAVKDTAAAAASAAHVRYGDSIDPDVAKSYVSTQVSKMLNDVVTAAWQKGTTIQERQASLNFADSLFQKYSSASVPGASGVPMLDAATQDRLGQTLRYQRMLLDGQADREGDKAAAVTRVSLERAYSAASAMVDNAQSATAPLTHLSDATIDAAFPKDPERAEAFKEQVSDLRLTSTYLDRLAGATPEQQRQIMASVPQPDPNDPNSYRSRLLLNRAMETAFDRTAKALNADPAGYVVRTHPEIATLGQAAQKDPSQFPTYANAVLGIQTQMGIPESARSVLPMQAAQQMASSIMADPTAAPAKLRSMEQQYGAYWPAVWRDLSTVKGGLPVAYQAVGTLDDERDASLVARWLGETQKSQKTANDFLGEKAVSDIKTFVRTDPTVGALTSSLSKSGSSTAQVDGVLQAIDTLAYGKSFYDHDTRAAADAVASFVGKYDFSLPGAPRVPSDRADAVSANARSILGAMSVSKIAIPNLYGQPGQPTPQEYLDQLQAAPTWITSPSADALWLMDIGGRLVRDQKGQPIAVPFAAPLMPDETGTSPGVVPGL